jgi:hypothetical protein
MTQDNLTTTTMGKSLPDDVISLVEAYKTAKINYCKKFVSLQKLEGEAKDSDNRLIPYAKEIERIYKKLHKIDF